MLEKPEILAVLDRVSGVRLIYLVHDQLGGGRDFRPLNVIDDFSRESLVVGLPSHFP